ncbi:unnamed protein product [Blepharisma stoltei]|uniref:Uncharacterized protein n=1 Tax=Blepharisma stoltei TaxID=1481888 RepID=A0AAU9JF72_9CILI|nr:unnamed protein product [Blepharisma stoltei]
MVVDVNHSISMSAFNRLGRLLYDIGLCSDYAQSIEKLTSSKYSQSSLEENLEFFASIMLDLENIQKHLLDDFSKWSYCSNSEILVKSYIPIWLFHENQYVIAYDNLYDTVSRFIGNGNSFISEIKSNLTHEDNAKFLMINGIGYSWDYLNMTMTGIVDCEINRVKSTGINIKVLLYVGLSTLGILVLIVTGFITIVSRKHDEYWNFILNNAQSSLAKLKIACIDRLITAHGIDYASETTLNSQKNIKRRIKTKNYVGYTWRLIIFLATGASYYLLLHLYLYPKCETMMINRPKFINTFNLKRSLLSRLLIFSRDVYSPYFIKIFNTNYAFPSSKIMFEKTADDIYKEVQLLKKRDFLDLMSDELKTMAFEKDMNSTLDFSQYGVESAILGLVNEIVSLSHIKNMPSFVLQILATYSVAIQTEIGQEFDLADRDSKRLIEDQLKIIIDVMIIYVSAMCALFFFYYLPYLNYQISKLKRFAILPIILSMEADKNI